MGVPYRTLSEMAMGLGNPDITNIVDEITKTTAIVPDASFIEASGMLDHTGMRKLSLPENAWVTVDEGGTASKGHKELYTDKLGIIESWQVSRQKENMIAPDPQRVESEDQMDHVVSMGLDVEKTLIYGTGDTREFQGIMPRFTKVNKNLTEPAFLTLGNGGTTANKQSSVLMVVWGRGAANMLTPRYHATAGIQVTKGDWQVVMEDGKNFFEKKTQFLMMTGLSVANRYSVIRIGNIETETTGETFITQMKNLRKNLYRAFTLLPMEFKSRVRIYAPGNVLAGLNSYYDDQVKPVTYRDAIPQNAIGDVMFDRFVLRQVDSMLGTEAVVPTEV